MKDLILDIIFHPVAETVIFAALGLFVAGFKKYRKLIKELLDVPRKLSAARSDDSPGGSEITTEEWAAIGKELVDVLEAGAPLFKRKRA